MDQVLLNNQTQFDRVCDKMKRLLIKKQKLRENQPSQVMNGLFIGNYTSAIDKKFISSNNIGLIITCLKINDKDKLPEVQYKQILIKDKNDEKISLRFNQFQEAVHNHILTSPERKCLVNCFSGKSRSSTLVLAYLMKEKNLTFQQAFSFLKQKYPLAQPNPGFINQLKQYQSKNKSAQLKINKEQKKQESSVSSAQKKECVLNDQQNKDLTQVSQNQIKDENINKEDVQDKTIDEKSKQTEQLDQTQKQQKSKGENMIQESSNTENHQMKTQMGSQTSQKQNDQNIQMIKAQAQEQAQNKQQFEGKQLKQGNGQIQLEEKDHDDHPGQQSQGRMRKKNKKKKKK